VYPDLEKKKNKKKNKEIENKTNDNDDEFNSSDKQNIEVNLFVCGNSTIKPEEIINTINSSKKENKKHLSKTEIKNCKINHKSNNHNHEKETLETLEISSTSVNINSRIMSSRSNKDISHNNLNNFINNQLQKDNNPINDKRSLEISNSIDNLQSNMEEITLEINNSLNRLRNNRTIDNTTIDKETIYHYNNNNTISNIQKNNSHLGLKKLKSKTKNKNKNKKTINDNNIDDITKDIILVSKPILKTKDNKENHDLKLIQNNESYPRNHSKLNKIKNGKRSVILLNPQLSNISSSNSLIGKNDIERNKSNHDKKRILKKQTHHSRKEKKTFIEGLKLPELVIEVSGSQILK